MSRLIHFEIHLVRPLLLCLLLLGHPGILLSQDPSRTPSDRPIVLPKLPPPPSIPPSGKTYGHSGSSVLSLPINILWPEVERIDSILDEYHKKNQIEPNPPLSDALFLRRAYLLILGRIPNLSESLAFHQSATKNRRRSLIDYLLNSEGYASHQFNYWADLLRIQSRPSANISGTPYVQFVKNSLRSNKPYDLWVRELLTASGTPWENGATGYFFRDEGMPLDHMSNTLRVFLGTQLVCAQCHDHPFDRWTQKDFYQISAFTFGTTSKSPRREQSRQLQAASKQLNLSSNQQRQLRQIADRLRYNLKDSSKALTYPEDYAYDDARPQSRVTPSPLFSPELPADWSSHHSPREAFAQWLTSPQNPRFTINIVNRLWKQVMGLGLIEPVDDFQDDVVSSNPELLRALEDLYIRLGFDTKQFLRVLLNTQSFQRLVSTAEPDPDAPDPYPFPGPILRRMSAEQFWDSILTLAIPSLDQRKAPPRSQDIEDARVQQLSLQEIATEIRSRSDGRSAQTTLRNRIQILEKELEKAKAGNQKNLVRQLQGELQKSRAALQKVRQASSTGRSYLPQVNSNLPKTPFPADWVRASELTSPAPSGHLLRQFGQSDRESIDNASREHTVPQMLTLINGKFYDSLWQPGALLPQYLKTAKTPSETLDLLFLATLARFPTPEERAMILPDLQANPESVAKDVLWSLLNSRQFIFIQ